MSQFLACAGIASVIACGLLLSAIHDELVRIRKALTKKATINVMSGREHGA